MNREQFQGLLWQKGRELYRDMPWRTDTRPYYILVSELMLQQTQVTRVIPKFNEFIARFPDEKALTKTSLADVLQLWQGLGYNRRAKFLHDAAAMIAHSYDGIFPNTQSELQKLPGVGKNTAGAIVAYAFNEPSLFVETNIRTVYIYHFFPDADTVSDAEIITKLEETIDREHPREFYWALMDYGAHLKSLGVKSSARSKHYIKQSPLEGSVRQVRGQIIAVLSRGRALTETELQKEVSADSRYERAYRGLVKDELIVVSEGRVYLPETNIDI